MFANFISMLFTDEDHHGEEATYTSNCFYYQDSQFQSITSVDTLSVVFGMLSFLQFGHMASI